MTHDEWVERVWTWHTRVEELKAEGLSFKEASSQARQELLDTESPT